MHELADGELRRVTVDPLDFGLTRATAADLRGADAATNAQAVRAVLAGEKGPHRDIALLNAAAALVVAGLAPDLAAGIDAAAASIDGGRAAGALAELVRLSPEAAAEEAKATT